MKKKIIGLHHVTAIASDPQRNIDFYVGVLGLRLLKRTVNFDLLLLHGTGGNEHDLIPLGRSLDPAAALLSPRGKVLENGMPRFFRRFAEGVFDIEDLKRRADELADFISSAAQQYGGVRHLSSILVRPDLRVTHGGL